MKNLILKKWMLLLAFLIVGWCAWAQTATAPSGIGTSGDPYQIATLNNLYWVTQNSSGWVSGTYFIQTADIDASATTSWNSGAGFSPIGNGTTNFQANYDGQNQKIEGLFINSPAAIAGLFGVVGSSGVINNVGVTNVNFTGVGYVGGLAALFKGTAANCYSTGSVNTTSSSYEEGAGGFVGSNYGNISNSYSSCTVAGDDEIGGFIGLNCKGSLVSKCYCTGNVSATSDHSYAGGFVGRQVEMVNDAEINNCFSRGNVSGVASVGGFVGENLTMAGNLLIKKCYSTGSVTGTTDVGGFVGADLSTIGNISDSFFDAETDGLVATVSGTTEGNGDFVTGRNTAEMKAETTFTGWDFTTIWEISSGVNDGYPAFQWMPDAPDQPMQLKFTTTDDDRGIDLPLFGTVNCTVDWGDGDPIETFTTEGTQWHTFATAGTYTVSINGSLTQFGYYDDEDDKGWDGAEYLTEVVDFGSVGLTSLSGAFADADNLSAVPDTLPPAVTDLSYCFYLNNKASVTNLNLWDVGHVTNMSAAFLEAPVFNQDISTWDVSGATNMKSMFKRASAFNQDISIWDVSGVTNMEDMLREASAFNQPIGVWDVSSVTTMEGMFQSALAFNQDINDWVVGSVKNMSGIFSGASAFNQRISDWDVSTVTDMSWMFSGATAFDQSLTGWDINSVTTMEEMFKNVTLSTANYDSILTAWAAQPVQSNVVFDGGNSQYSTGAATTARGELTGPPKNWVITDGGQLFTVTTQAASAITATTATGNGTIVSVGSGNATKRGVIYYPYTNTDKEIGGADVTNVSEEPGPFVAGAFTASLTGLSVNAHYNARAHATNTDDGTKYGARVDFWTLANVPSPPAVINPTAISLDVAVNANSNPAGVLFAIQDSALVSQYVQINGSRGATVVWQTAAAWDTITITGLTTGVTYYFRVKAKNDNNEETAFGLATAQNTCSNPTDGGEIGGEQAISSGSTPDTLVNEEEASNYGGTLEYQWQQASLTDSTDFADITDAEAKFYVPGVLSSTTWFRRLARVACKTDWTGAAASNVVKITVQHIPEVDITAPSTGSQVYTNPITISGTASDSDGNLSYVQVKLNSGTWQTATGSDNWTIDFNLAPGKNTILARAADSTFLYSDTATIKVLLSIQIINIPQGWSAVSSYLTPLNPTLPVMMNEITSTNNLIMMLSEYGYYWPPYNTNTIGNWSIEKGYKVKMNNAQEFTVRGDTLANRSLSLSQGYHIIPVLTNVACPITSVFADPLNDIFFMYDVKTNALYWPQGGIFSLTSLMPGKGYITSFNKAVTLTYPAYSGLKAGILMDNTEPEMNGPWALDRTGDVHFVAISSEAVNKLENASFIGAFDSFGNCIGYTEVDGSGDSYLLSVYGNDAFTDGKDGGEAGEIISFRSYNSSSQTETELIAEFNTSFPNADGVYISGGQSAIVNFKESSTGIGEAGIAVEVLIYPNPAKDLVNIATKGFRTLEGLGTLMTADGKPVKTFTIAGIQTQLDVQDLQPGIYILRFENAENVVIKRVVIQ